MSYLPKPPTLSLQELYKERNRQRNHEIQTFHRILELCHRQIRHAAKNGSLNTMYEVPAFVLGIPLFNRRNCCDYIFTQLQSIGLFVQELNTEFNLFISWDPQQIKNKK